MRATLLAAAMLLLWAAPAYGAELRIAGTVTRDGDPGLTAGLTRDGSTVEWRRCAHGGTVCESLPARAYRVRGRGAVAFPGKTPAGTVFEAVATKDGVVTNARTHRWTGRVRSTSAPVLLGEAVVGKSVTAAKGGWTGGWESRRGVSMRRDVYACKGPNRRHCWLIACGPTVTLEPRWAGWYVLAAEHFSTADPVCHRVLGCMMFPMLLAPPFYDRPRRGTTFALSAPLGPIAESPARFHTAFSLRPLSGALRWQLAPGRVSNHGREI